MPRSLREVDVTDVPELLRIAEEVEETQESLVLQRDGEDIAVVTPVSRQPRRRHGRRLTKDDPLGKLVGTAASAEETDASKKHEYLAEALSPQSPRQ